MYSNPIEHAYISMCARLDKIANILLDRAEHLTDSQIEQLQRTAYAIEEEWIIEPTLRAPRS